MTIKRETELARVLENAGVRAAYLAYGERAIHRDRVRDMARDMARDIARARRLARTHDKAPDLDLVLDAASTLARILANNRDRAGARMILDRIDGAKGLLRVRISYRESYYSALPQQTRSAATKPETNPMPPVIAERLLAWLSSATYSEAARGDFFEIYESAISKHGRTLAQIEYCWQVFRSAPGFLAIRLRQSPLVIRLARIGTNAKVRKVSPPR